jgi:hypothetical protein
MYTLYYKKKPDTEGQILYDSTYMKYLGHENPYRQKVDLQLLWAGQEEE